MRFPINSVRGRLGLTGSVHKAAAEEGAPPPTLKLWGTIASSLATWIPASSWWTQKGP